MITKTNYHYYIQINHEESGEKYNISLDEIKDYSIVDLKELFGQSILSSNFLGVIEFENHNPEKNSSRKYQKEIYNLPLFMKNEKFQEEETLRLHFIDNVMDRIKEENESKKELVNISNDMYRELNRYYNKQVRNTPGMILC